MADKQRKTIYHSELVKLGEIVVDVTSDVLESKFGKGKFYCSMIVDGVARDYTVENEACAEALKDRSGQRITMEAQGTKESANISVTAADYTPEGEGEAKPQPRPAPAPKPAPAPSKPRPAATPAKPQASVPAPAPSKPQAKLPSTGQLLTKLVNLTLLCETASMRVTQELRDKRGHETSAEAHQARVASYFIALTRDGVQHNLSGDHLIDITPKQPAAPQPEPEPEPADQQD